jgi:hypothetical protein
MQKNFSNGILRIRPNQPEGRKEGVKEIVVAWKRKEMGKCREMKNVEVVWMKTGNEAQVMLGWVIVTEM